ncbi:MAG: hypothetical protein ACJAUL_000285 [Paraglaciecola sp.]|jgi:hypothetical protein
MPLPGQASTPPRPSVMGFAPYSVEALTGEVIG